MPYHLAPRSNGEPVVIDWEYGSLAGFPGIDAGLWAVNVGARHLRVPAETISSSFVHWACQREFGGIRMTPHEARAVLALAAYFTYEALAGTDAEAVQRVRASLWAHSDAHF